MEELDPPKRRSLYLVQLYKKCAEGILKSYWQFEQSPENTRSALLIWKFV